MARMKRIFGCCLVLICFLTGKSLAASSPQPLPVEIFVKVDRTEFIGQQDIVLKADIVFFQQANPFWERLKEISFSPFEIQKIVFDERRVFEQGKDLTRDFREVTFLLSLPASNKCGVYTIPSFALGYSYFEGKGEIKEEAKSTAIKVEKVPFLVIAETEKDVMTIGEINTTRLTVWREKYIRVLNYELKSAGDTVDISKEGFRRWLKSLEVRDKKITDLNNPSFEGFKILSSPKWSEFESENILKEIIEYRFSFYDHVPLETSIPDFHLWYLDESKKEERPKEVVISPQYILINSLLSPRRRSVEDLKLLEASSLNSLYYFAYGSLVFGGIGFLLFAGSVFAGLSRPSPKSAEIEEPIESFSEVRGKLLALKESTVVNREIFVCLRNELCKLLGIMVGIPARQSLAKTSSQMVDLMKQAGLSEDFVSELKFCLETLERSIYFSKFGKNFSEVWEKVDALLSRPELLCRSGKKKFLIF